MNAFWKSRNRAAASFAAVLALMTAPHPSALADCYSDCRHSCTLTESQIRTGPDGMCMYHCETSCRARAEKEAAPRDLYGAIAVDPQGYSGKSVNASSAAEAERVAIGACRKVSPEAGKCEVAASYRNQCAAVAKGTQSSAAAGAGPGKPATDAAAAAIAACQNQPGNGKCWLVMSGCSAETVARTREEIAKDLAITGAVIGGIRELIKPPGARSLIKPDANAADTNAAAPVSISSVGSFWDASWFSVPSSSLSPDIARSFDHIRSLDSAGAKYLSCTYGDPKRGLGPIHFWYQRVMANSAEIAAISPHHRLLVLGDRAFQQCPPTYGEASTYARSSYQAGQAQARQLGHQ